MFYPIKKNLVLRVALLLLLVPCAYFAHLYLVLCFTHLPKRGSEFTSPTYTSNKILFIDDFYLELYAKPDDCKPQFISRLEWEYSFHFSRGQWTQDGRVFVCALKSENETNDSNLIAYDFSTAKAIVPSWVGNYPDNMMPEGKGFELNVQKLIVAHGGLRNQIIDYDTVKEHEEKRFWGKPPDPGRLMYAKPQR